MVRQHAAGSLNNSFPTEREVSVHFKGKVAIVTGSSSGIGKETAKRLVAHDASVVLSGRDEAKLRSAAKEIFRNLAWSGSLLEISENA